MIRDSLEKTCYDLITASMEYNGEWAAVYDEIAAASDETLINYILDFVNDIIG